MKYEFTYNCYWDSEKMQVFREGKVVNITPSQTKLLKKLMENNGKFVSHNVLYLAMTGQDPGSTNGWKDSISNQFTRDKKNEKGLLIRIPEITTFFKHSKSEGYKISIPEADIIGNENKKDADTTDSWYTNSYFHAQNDNAKRSNETQLSKKIQNYLKGAPCIWPLIFSSLQYSPVKREIINDLINTIDDGISAIALTGAGGEGKTTILMQLCAELYYSEKNVFYHAPTNKFDIPDGISDGIFLVDNPPNTAAFKEFISKAVIEGFTVIMTSRSNEWTALKQKLTDDTRRGIKEMEIPKISVAESKAFAKYVSAHITWIKRSKDELESLFLKDSYGFLYASMLLAIYDAVSLENIAFEIIDKISNFENGKDSLKILASVIFAEQAQTSITNKTFKSLCEKYSFDIIKVKEHLKKEVSLNGKLWQTRHESISKLFYKFLFTDGNWKEHLDEDEREGIIVSVLDVYLGYIENSNRIFYSKNPLTVEVSKLFVYAITVINNEETQIYLVQRLFESCRQLGFAIIHMVYFRSQNSYVRRELAEKCFYHKLPMFVMYNHWIKELLNDNEHRENAIEHLKILCMDMNATPNVWLTWAEHEVNAKNYGDESADTKYTARWIFNEGCKNFANNLPLWLKWSELETKLKNYGTADTKYTVQWIFNEGCKNCSNNLLLLQKWIETEISLGNYGTADTEYTVRWLFNERRKKYPTDPQSWLIWSDLECRFKEYGSVDTKYTARWIFNEGRKICPSTPHIWLHWGNLECSLENYGATDTEYTARWIFNEGCKSCQNYPEIWLHWGNLECSLGNYGTTDCEYSARWIYREACKGRYKDSQIWLHWAELEINLKNYGTVDNEYTARWIYREGSKYFYKDSQIWLHWAELEITLNNYGAIDNEYTARWILNEGCKNCDYDPNLWIHWGELEVKRENFGDTDTEYTARWIFNEGCQKHGYDDPNLWIHWAKLEEITGNIGDYNTVNSAAWLLQEICKNDKNNGSTKWGVWTTFIEKNKIYPDMFADDSPCAIIKKECLSEKSTVTHWITWAFFEEIRENIGNYSTEYSSAWLYRESCINYNRNNNFNCWLKWANFAYKHPMEDDNGEMINVNYVLQYIEKICNSLNEQEQLELDEFKGKLLI